MKIETFKIKKLFTRLDYNIVFKEGALTLITGPNGYGKTTLLNILFNLFAKRFIFFRKLAFESITLTFDNGGILIIEKKENKEKSSLIELQIELQYIVAGERYTYTYGALDQNSYRQLGNWLEGLTPNYQQIGYNKWRDRKTNRELTAEELLNENIDLIPTSILDSLSSSPINEPHILELLNSIQVNLIREQRLIKTVPVERGRSGVTYINTIEEYAEDLKNIIQHTQRTSLNRTQELDSSFPKRLMQATNTLSEDEFNNRFTNLLNKQDKLQEYGLSTSKPEKVTFDKGNEKVLSVYLEDSESKAQVFDDLLAKIDLFTEILLAKKFAFKQIKVDSTDGFAFYTDEGDRLNLADLSSGEKHEVILLYELLFKADGNVLFLIDEPELSLHVTWQETFLTDLFSVAKLRQLRFLVATHSPQILSDYIDLAIDLYDLAKNKSHEA